MATRFRDAVKQRTIAVIKEDLGQVDLVVYSLASPRRTHPKTGEVFNSTLKPVGKSITVRGIDTDKGSGQGRDAGTCQREGNRRHGRRDGGRGLADVDRRAAGSGRAGRRREDDGVHLPGREGHA